MQTQHVRHQYLDALGITSWLSRSELPGAAPSDDWVESYVYDASKNESVDVLSTQEVETKALSSVSANANRDLKEHMQSLSQSFKVTPDKEQPSIPVPDIEKELSSDTGRSEEKRVEQVSANQSQTLESMPRHTPFVARSNKEAPVMRLMFWQYNDILIVDSLPTQTRGTLTSVKYEQLLVNLIKAMQLDTARLNAQSPPYVLNWPTLAGLSIDQGWDQAASAVQHKLSKILQNYNPAIVLMLGESSAQMMMNMEDDFDAMRGIVFSLRTNIKAITTYSLTQMLNVPGCKKEVWADLQKVLPVTSVSLK